MEPEHFISELAKIAVPKEKYLKLGFSLESAILKSESFFPVKKKIENFQSKQSLVQLIENYDMTHLVNISNISFDDTANYFDKFIQIGWVHEVILAIDSESNELVTIDPYFRTRVLLHCAKNSSMFLEAFLIYGVANYFIDRNNLLERERELKKIQIAIDVAGGEKYRQFWMHLYS